MTRKLIYTYLKEETKFITNILNKHLDKSVLYLSSIFMQSLTFLKQFKNFLIVGNLRERDRWGDPRVEWRIILGWIFKKWDVDVRTGLGWLRIGTSGGRL
jgi:hypothetical protein